MQVKIFNSNDPKQLEAEINAFIESLREDGVMKVDTVRLTESMVSGPNGMVNHFTALLCLSKIEVMQSTLLGG